MDTLEQLQWLAFGSNMAFIILLTFSKRIGWLFGIAGAALSIYIFYVSGLVSEASLNIFYVIMGIYGWVFWSRKTENNQVKPIIEYHWIYHVVLVSGSAALAWLMGYANEKNPHAAVPYADAFSTAFSFTATYLEARKVLSSWLYWIAINIYSVWLYGQKEGNESDLRIMQMQMAIFAVFSVAGFVMWRREKRKSL